MSKMNRVKNLLSFIVIGVISLSVKLQIVNAEAYEFELVPYNVTDVCNFEDETAVECLDQYFAGDLDDYRVINNKIEKDDIIMLLLKMNINEDMNLGGIQTSYLYDSTQMTYLEAASNDYTNFYDYGISPAKPNNKGNVVASSKTTWVISIKDEVENEIGVIADPGDHQLPMIKSGIVSAFVFQVASDIEAGSIIPFTPKASNTLSQFVTGNPIPQTINASNTKYNPLTLTIESNLSSDGTLKELVATGNNNLEYPFGFVPSSTSDTTYNIIVPNAVENIKFSGTPTDATIKGATGLINIAPVPSTSEETTDQNGHSLNIGLNEIKISVTPASGPPTIYTINVTRLSNDTKLTSVTGTNGVSFNPNQDGFINVDEASNTITVPYNVSTTDITATLNDTNATIDPALKTWAINSDHNNETTTKFTIKVKAEDCKYTTADVPGNVCTEKTYNFAIKRTAPTKDVTISSIRVDDITSGTNELLNQINPATDTFNINVEPNVTRVKVMVTPNDSKSTVIYTNADTNGEKDLAVGDTTIIARVISEAGEVNGTTKEYTINIHRKSDENKLASLTINTNPTGTWSTPFNPALDKTVGVYTYTIAPTVSDITVTANVQDTGKSFVTILDMSNTETEDDSTKVLTTDTKTFSSTITKIGVIVTAENGDKRIYIVNIARTQSDDNTLKSLSITPGSLKETFQSNVKNYTAEVEADVRSITVTAELNDTQNAKIVEITGADNLNVGENIITIKTKAENGAETSYEIIVTRKAYDIQTLDEIKVGYDGNPTAKIDGFNKENFSYNLSTKTNPLPYSTNTINIEYVVSHETVNVSGDVGLINLSSFAGRTLVNNGTGKQVYEYKFHINAKSQAGNTKQYVLTLYREANNDGTVSSVTVHNTTATIDPNDDKVYHIELENSFDTVTRADVTITPGVSSSRVTLITDTLNLSTANENIFHFNITAENGEIENYTIYITRKKSSDNSIRRVYLKLPGETTITGETRYCVFTENDTNCKINVPSGTTGYTLEAEVAPTATLNYIDGPVYIMSSASSDRIQVRTIEVSAENEDKKTYTVTIERALSAINYLNTLQTTANSETLEEVPSWNAVNPTYNLTVPANQTSIRIFAEAQVQSARITSTDYTGVVDSTIDFTKNLDYGNNVIVLTVTAEDNTQKIYTVNVTRSANMEPRLSDITINGRSINEFLNNTTFDNLATKPINDTIKEYTLNDFEYAISSITIGATSMDTEHGTIRREDLGLKNIETISYENGSTEYTNTFTIRAYAHDTSVYCDYIIHVKRKANNDTAIQSVGITYDGNTHPATFDSNENVYRITVPNTVEIADINNVVVTVADPLTQRDPKATVSMNATNLLTDDTTNKNVNTHKFVVHAEDGTEKEYTMMITRELSDYALLSDIRVLDNTTNTNVGSFNPSFDATTGVYTVSVPVTTNEIKVEVDKGETHQTITGILPSYTLTDSKATVNITVTAEDNITAQPYTLNIIREASNNNTLKEIIVTDNLGITHTVTKDENISHRYNVTIPGNVSNITLEAIPDSPLATPIYNGVDEGTTSTYTLATAGTYSKEIIIKSEAGNEASYILVITKEQKNDATLKTLRYRHNEADAYIDIDLSNGETDEEGAIIFTLPEVENAISKIYLDAEANDAPDASVVSGTGETTLAVEENTIPIIVRAQNGDTLTYKIKVSRKKSSNAFLQMLSVKDYTFQEQPVDLKNNFNYTIHVNETKDKLNKSEITARPEDGNAHVEFNEEEISLSTTSDNIMTLKVIAEDGTEQPYTIKVIRPKSTDATLKAVDLNNTATLSPSITPNNRIYTITVPYGQETFEIRGIPNVSTSQVIRGDNVYRVSETTSVELEVEPEDKSIGTEIYTFNVVIAASNDASLQSLSVTGYPFKEGNKIISFTQGKRDYSIGDIVRSVDKILVNASPTNAASKIQYYLADNEITSCSGLTSCEMTLDQVIGSKQIRVLVTAADNVTTQNYTIDYNKVYSSNNLLANMEIFDIDSTRLTTNEAWNETTTAYTLNVANNIDSIRLVLTAKEAQSLISVNGDAGAYQTYTKDINLIEGSNAINIVVKAEDNSEKPYTLVITRAMDEGSDDAFLSNLTVHNGEDPTIDYPLTPTFTMLEENYSIGEIPFALTNLKINLTKNEGHSTVKYFINGVETSLDENGNLPIPKESGTITIRLTAEDGRTQKTYNITYTKNPSTNAYLKNIIVNKSVLNPAFENNLFVYTVELPSDEDSIDIAAILEDPKSSITMDGQPYVSGSTKTLTGLAFGTTSVKYVITAEDGTILTYEVIITRLSETEQITSEEYGHVIEDGYIKTVSDNTTVLDLKNQLDNDNEKLVIYDSDGITELTDSDLVGTEKIVKLIIDGEQADSKIIIVLGDTTGDGIIDIWDNSDILNHYVGRIRDDGVSLQLTGAKFIAGDINADGVIDIWDGSDILNHYVGRNLIHQKETNE